MYNKEIKRITDMNSCPHCNDGNLLKASPNLVAKDGVSKNFQ